MNNKTAEVIGRKARALKHCEKLLREVDKNGQIEVKLGGTGMVIPCVKNDAIYTLFQSIKFQLVHEINAIEIVMDSKSKNSVVTTPRATAAPFGASDPEEGFCKHCGQKFIKHDRRQKYCCVECRTKEQYGKK